MNNDVLRQAPLFSALDDEAAFLGQLAKLADDEVPVVLDPDDGLIVALPGGLPITEAMLAHGQREQVPGMPIARAAGNHGLQGFPGVGELTTPVEGHPQGVRIGQFARGEFDRLPGEDQRSFDEPPFR